MGIVGGGQMGSGIAYVAAANAKLNVTLVDISEKQLDKAQKYIGN